MLLADAWRSARAPHLVTVLDGLPHVAPVVVDRDRDAFRVAAPGRRTRAALAATPAVTLVWSPAHDGGHSLIVDGVGVLDGDALLVRPSRAVLHRPGTPAPGAACDADCVELDPSLS